VKRFCIIGAGACGLAVAKTFTERGIPFDCFEALADIGGVWPVMRTTLALTVTP